MSPVGWISHSSVQTTRPAALGLHAAHGGMAAGIAIAHAVAMRHLVEAVLAVTGPIRTGSNRMS